MYIRPLEGLLKKITGSGHITSLLNRVSRHQAQESILKFLGDFGEQPSLRTTGLVGLPQFLDEETED